MLGVRVLWLLSALFHETRNINLFFSLGLSYFRYILPTGILKVIGSVDKIMSKCDADGDGAIGIDTDMPKTEETCLASCFKRKAFKGAFFPDCDL